MYSLEDGRKQLARYNRISNNIVKICLDFKTPNEMLKEYLAQPSANLDSSACCCLMTVSTATETKSNKLISVENPV